MKIEKNFVVKAPPEEVWDFLTDPHRVAGCVPGGEITEQIDEQTHGGTITLKVGSIALRYKGKVHFERLDAAARQAELVASGRETRGKGGADARVTSRLRERGPGETEVDTVADLTVTGLLAQMGRGMIQDVSDQLFETFTDAVRAQLEGTAPAAGEAPAEGAQSGAPAQAEPIQMVSLGTKVLGRAAARAARRPSVWIAAVVILVLLWLWLRG
jgi:carbon monoxide dehydrogenase subunit G